MSEFTTEVRFICENYANYNQSQNYTKVSDIIQEALPKIFDFDFPIFDESYRNVLETKIIKHYYTREIGLETVGLWKLKLDTKLNEIMPYYNKLYESELIEFNPMWDVDYTIDHDREIDKTGTVDNTGTVRNAGSVDNTGTVGNVRTLNSEIESTERTVYDESISRNNETNMSSTTSNNNDDAFSDTPQNGLSDVKDLAYLTTFRNIKNDGTNTGDTTVEETTNRDETVNKTQGASKDDTENETRTDNLHRTEDMTRTDNLRRTDNLQTTDEYVQKVSGKMYRGSYSKMLNEFRDTFINIDLRIIKDLSELFMNVW